MKSPLSVRFLLMAALCWFFAAATMAQRSSRENLGVFPAKNNPPAHNIERSSPAVAKPTPPAVAASDCDNDLTAPEVNCPAGQCLPTARAAYLISFNGEPWGQNNNFFAMEAVFGAGNWDAFNFESVDVATLLSPAYKVIFLEGSYYGAYALNDFLQANLPALENWVAAGGALFLNCAPNDAPGTMNLGFGGVTLYPFNYIDQVTVQAPGHPIFNTPFVPANGDFTGNSFLHAIISDPGGQILISDASGSAGLTERVFGAGKVYFGGMTMPYYHTPQPNAQNLRQNILADLNALCNSGLTIVADAGQCFATILDASLDATASDDCVLASLTHDFAGAPTNTTLNGAVFPAGSTTVRWTAMDAAGNTATCEFVVWVREPEAPVITCPGDISVPVDPGSCAALVIFTLSATDNCLPPPATVSTPASGDPFPIGSTTVIATATDVSGNPGTCSFTVTVTANPEVCNGLDDDCNGLVDDGAPGNNVFYADADGDGYGDPNQTVTSCIAPPGYVENALDCDDTNYYIQPGMWEYCNGIDDNCDGNIDEGVAPAWYADADADGYGDPATVLNACDQPAGYIPYGGDCDDTNAYIHPGALEDCTNLTDENCDGILGENNFTIEETHTDVNCNSNPDGSINLTMAPAQNYPVILWSTGAWGTTTLTGLAAGSYKVTVTNECGTTKTKTFVIEPAAEPALQVTLTGTDYICGGTGNGSVTAAASDGCGGYTYEWLYSGETQPAISGLSGGTYTVIVTDACGCTQSGSFTINEPEAVSAYFGAVIPLLDGTYFIQVVPYGGVAPYQFRRSTPPVGFTAWSAGNGFLGVLPGEYVFEVEDSKGCTVQITIILDPLSSQPPEGTDAQARTNMGQPASGPDWSVSLFPNPNTGVFTVGMPEPPPAATTFYVTGLAGQVLLEKQAEPGSDRQTVDAGLLPPGVYFLQVMVAGKVVAVEKFVKQ